MKKLVSGFLTLVLTLAFLILSFGAPAHASIPDFISYCQATSSPTNPYVLIKNAPLKALIDGNGEFKQGGINAGDKVGPFSWDFGGDSHGTFGGQNWDSSLDPNFLTVNDCNPVQNTPLVTPPVTFTPATCADLDGNVIIGTLPTHVNTKGALLTGKNWNVDFTKDADTTYNTYVWDASAVLHHTFTVTDPVTDPLWDSSKGICRMPDTGAGGGINQNTILLAGGLIFAGMLFLGASTFINRRKS